jgi:hypothetical protein
MADEKPRPRSKRTKRLRAPRDEYVRCVWLEAAFVPRLEARQHRVRTGSGTPHYLVDTASRPGTS